MDSIAFVHLGCDKNRVDTENAMGLVAAAGYPIKDDPADASLVIVNTCGFIEAARAESVDTIVQLESMGKKIIVIGCLSQYYGEQILTQLPAVSAVIGTGKAASITDSIRRALAGERFVDVDTIPEYVADETLPRARPQGAVSAYVRVAEGCDYRCSYCVIPRLRGPQRSRAIESIVEEVRTLAEQGAREVVLIAQNTTTYGTDRYGAGALAQLLQALRDVPIPWIRLHYLYPTGLTQEILDTIRDIPNVLPYFDIPLQHAHPEILRAMNRPFRASIIEDVLGRIRETLPDAILRTTFIVGFPGETRKHFDHLLEFMRTHRFDHVGAFCFSPEEGTDAYDLPKRVSARTAQARFDELMATQQAISSERNRAQIGKLVEVLIEKPDPQATSDQAWLGRSARFAPDVDGVIFVTGKAQIGDLLQVRITDAEVYDLHGEVV